MSLCLNKTTLSLLHPIWLLGGLLELTKWAQQDHQEKLVKGKIPSPISRTGSLNQGMHLTIERSASALLSFKKVSLRVQQSLGYYDR